VSATYRVDPMTGATRIVAPARAATPRARSTEPVLPDPPGPCPFCPGAREDEPVRAAWPDAERWKVRVLDNAYPIVTPARDLRSGVIAPAHGWHEVVVDDRAHDTDLSDLPPEHLAAWLRVLRDRVRELQSRAGVVQVQVFRNRGRRAGSSQPHPHTQIMTTAALGPSQRARAERAHPALLREQVAAAGERLVFSTDAADVLTPFAPRANVETWVAPRDPAPFVDTPDASLRGFSGALQEALELVLRVRPGAYNLLFHLPAVGARSFWYVEIAPRGGVGAGLEWVSGMTLVNVAPEDAAARLRNLRTGN